MELDMTYRTNFIGKFVACTGILLQVSRYMKLENWDGATCSTLAQICTTLVYFKHSSH